MRFVPVSLGLVAVIALIAAIVAFELRDDRDDSALPDTTAFPGVSLEVIAEGESPTLAVDREMAGGVNNRAYFENLLPELAPLIPAGFDFETEYVLFWVRPAPGPFGAGGPHLKAISGTAAERQMTIEWKDRCGPREGGSYMLARAPGLGFSGSYWSVRHEVESPGATNTVDFELLSTGGWALERTPEFVVLDSREDYLAFLSDYRSRPDPALDSVDFETETVILSVGTPAARRPLQRIVVEDGVARVFSGTVLQFGPIPAIEAYIYEAFSVAKSDIADVTEWQLVEDTEQSATGCD